MFIKLKGKDTELTTTSIIEQQLYKNGEKKGWLLSLNVNGDFTAQEIDAMLDKDSISEIALVGENEQIAVISGYEKVTSCVVRYSEDKSVAEIQLIKGV